MSWRIDVCRPGCREFVAWFCRLPGIPCVFQQAYEGPSGDCEAMRERITVVDEDRVQPGHASPATDRRDDGRLARNARLALHATLEQGADDRFMHKAVAGL